MRWLLDITLKLVVQLAYSPFKIKMQKNKLTLDGSEKSMIPIIKNDAGRIFGIATKKTIPLEEFSAGTGVSDITIFTVDSRLIDERKKLSRKPITSATHIKVLSCVLQSDGIDEDKVISNTRLNTTTVRTVLSDLVSSRVLSRTDGKYYVAKQIKASSSDKIIAVEAKVRDWKSGIKQAMRYQEYADYSYLAIYESHIGSCMANRHIFERLGIGLIGVDDNGVKIHIQASYSPLTKARCRLLAYERMMSVVDDRYEAFVARNGFAANHSI